MDRMKVIITTFKNDETFSDLASSVLFFGLLGTKYRPSDLTMSTRLSTSTAFEF